MFKCDNNALCGQLKSAQEEVQHLRRKLDQNKVKLYDAEESFQHLKVILILCIILCPSILLTVGSE